jgi:hypothetical protein
MQTSTSAFPNSLQPNEYSGLPKYKEHWFTVSVEDAGDDRYALRAKALQRRPVLQKQEKVSIVVEKTGTAQASETRASKVRRKNVSKKAWPTYDPSLEKEDSDDEYYAARLHTVSATKKQYASLQIEE